VSSAEQTKTCTLSCKHFKQLSKQTSKEESQDDKNNKRGESLLNYKMVNNLIPLNECNEATFVTSNREQVIDSSGYDTNMPTHFKLTSRSASITVGAQVCALWNVARQQKYPPRFYRNRRKTNWRDYEELVSRSMQDLPKTIKSTEELDMVSAQLSRALYESHLDSCPKIQKRAVKHQPWWTGELEKIRHELRRLFNKCREK